jgi:hypothetical protein
MRIDDETLQKFINEHTIDLENIEKNFLKEKGEFTRCQITSNYMSKSLHVKI